MVSGLLISRDILVKSNILMFILTIWVQPRAFKFTQCYIFSRQCLPLYRWAGPAGLKYASLWLGLLLVQGWCELDPTHSGKTSKKVHHHTENNHFSLEVRRIAGHMCRHIHIHRSEKGLFWWLQDQIRFSRGRWVTMEKKLCMLCLYFVSERGMFQCSWFCSF